MASILENLSGAEVVAVSAMGILALLILTLKLVFCGKGFKLKIKKNTEIVVPGASLPDDTDGAPPYGLIFLLIIVELGIYAMTLVTLVFVMPG